MGYPSHVRKVKANKSKGGHGRQQIQAKVKGRKWRGSAVGERRSYHNNTAYASLEIYICLLFLMLLQSSSSISDCICILN